MIDLCDRLINRRIGVFTVLLLLGFSLSSIKGQGRSSPPDRPSDDFPEFELKPLSGGDLSVGRTPRSDDSERSVLPVTDDRPSDDGSFDWTQQRLSIADIEIDRAWPFEHGKARLTDAENDGYVALLRALMDRKYPASKDLPETVSLTSAWETAFYSFESVRRQAWKNGTVNLQLKSTEPADPFASGNRAVLSTTDKMSESRELTAYAMQVDMQVNPAEFVGRPVVMYGLFTPLEAVELQARETLEGEPTQFDLQRGFLRNLTNTETIAMVDAMSYVDAESQNKPLRAWPVNKRVAMPVLVKGWFVKLLGRNPLIFTDVVRVLTPRPYDDTIREHVRSKRRVSDDESWLFYETLRQLQVTSENVQAGIALKEQQKRVGELVQDIREQAIADSQVLDNQFRNGAIPRIDDNNVEGYETRRIRLDRQLEVRNTRHHAYQLHPETFPLFVDVFQNPDRWQGRLVTLRGHVRQVMTYDGDPTLFDGQPLHELWLFTNDSQHNPVVIVTPTLPKDFPRSAEIIDSVTVTGCFFKMYVYRSKKENRLAPLLLAGHVSWAPTSDQVLELAKNGHIPAGSKRLAAAKAENSRSVSDTMILLLGFVALLAAMTVWGRVLRDRRERKRLLLLVDERPDFRHTSQNFFSGPFAESQN